MTAIPLKSRSRLACAVYRMMAGQRVTTVSVPVGRNFFEQQSEVLCTVLSQLAAGVPAGPERKVLVPVPDTSIVMERNRLRRAFEDRGVPCAESEWSNPFLQSLHLASSGDLRVDFAFDADLRFRGDRYLADLLVVRLGPYRHLTGIDRFVNARQVLVLKDLHDPSPRRIETAAPSMDRNWGDIPLEVLFAGGPR